MISLSAAQDKALRAQIAETIATVAEYDFPERWDGLIDVRDTSIATTLH